MKRNRKMPRRMSVVAERAMHVGAVIVMSFVMVILYLLASSSCTQLMKSIGEKEKALARLEESRQRETARWEEMTTPRRLESDLNRHGLSMHLAKDAQKVRMRADGVPYKGQIALTKAEARRQASLTAVASVRTAPAAAPRTPVASVRRAGLASGAGARRGAAPRRR